MNKTIIGTLIGCISLSLLSTGVGAMEDSNTTVPPPGSGAILDPYEQCIAYTKLKQIEGVDCKAKAATMIENQQGKKEYKAKEYPRVGGTGDINPSEPIKPKSPRPPMGSGAMQEHEMNGMSMGIGKLTPEQRIELIKIIHDYLESKGITTNIPEIIKDKKEEIRDTIQEIKTDTREEIKDATKEIKTNTREALKTKQAKIVRSKQELLKTKLEEIRKKRSAM